MSSFVLVDVRLSSTLIFFYLFLFSPADSRIVAYYSFDEGAGTSSTPLSGYCNRVIPDASLTSGSVYTSSADAHLGNSAVQLNGGLIEYGGISSSNPNFQDPSDQGEYAFAVWARPPSSGSYSAGDSFFLLKEGSFEYFMDKADKYKVDINNGQTDAKAQYDNIPNIDYSDGYRLFGMTYDSETISLWLDAVERTGESSIPFFDDPAIPLVTGDQDKDFFFDELYIFDAALTQSEWNTIYAGGAGITPEVPNAMVVTSQGQPGIDSGGVTVFQPQARSSISLTALDVLTNATLPGDYTLEWSIGDLACSTSSYTVDVQGSNAVVQLADELPLTINGFACISGPFPSISTSVPFRLDVQPLPPTITVNIENFTLFNVGSPVTLSIGVDGVPIPDVIWQRQVIVVCPNSTFCGERMATGGVEKRSRYDPALDMLVNDHPFAFDRDARVEYIPRNDDTVRALRNQRRGNETTFITWEDLGTGATFVYTPSSNDSGSVLRALLQNSFGQTQESIETTLTETDTPLGDGNGDGNGDNGGDDGGLPSAAIAGSASVGLLALLACFCLCILCVCVILCIVIVALGMAAFVTGSKSGGEAIRLVRPDFEPLIFGTYMTDAPKFNEMDDLERLLIEHSPEFPQAILQSCATADLDKVCSSLIFLAYFNEIADELLSNRIEMEVEMSGGSEGVLFRSNSAAAKMFSKFAQLVGCEYVWRTLAKQVVLLNMSASAEDRSSEHDDDTLTINLTSLVSNVDLSVVSPDSSTIDIDLGDEEVQILELRLTAQKVLSEILSSARKVPSVMCNVIATVKMAVSERYSELAVYRAMGAFMFLRCYCPALMAPHVWGLLPAAAQPEAQRTLVLLAKVLQNLANNTLPGQKDERMVALDDFVTSNVAKLERFYEVITTNNGASHTTKSVPNVRENALEALWQHIQRARDKVEAGLSDGAKSDFQMLVS